VTSSPPTSAPLGTRPCRLALLTTVLAALLLAAAPSASAAPPADFVGITSEDVFVGGQHYRAENLTAQRGLGVGLLRQTFDWSQIEMSPGNFELGFHDGYVASAAMHGVRILPILFNPPHFQLGRTSGRASCAPRSFDTFARFARVLVSRYGPNGSLWAEQPSLPKLPITSWQIWNEPNLGIYWCNRSSARQYVRMLRAVGGAIKSVDRKAEIVTAGLPPSKLSSAIPIQRYIAQMYRAGARKAFNTMAINSYAKDQRELRTLLRGIRRQMNRRGHRRARIWITELGWGDVGPAHRFIVGAAGQASRISSSFRTITRLRKKLRLRGVVYYTWRDSSPYPPLFRDLWGLHTGLLDASANPKPAFFAFRDAVAQVR
jgi:polysaccharide biosynthesis protein PslG